MHEEEDLDIGGPVLIEELQQSGIAMGDIKKLQDAGFTTVEAVCFVPRKHLVQVKGLSDAKLDKILEAAHKLVDMGFQTAGNYLEKRKD